MKDKLIHRAAAAYHKWMREQEVQESGTVGWSIERDLKTALDRTGEMLRWVRAYNKVIEPNRLSKRLVIQGACKSIVDEMLPELCSDTNICISRVSSYLDMISSEKPEDKTVNTPSILDIFQEIKAINDAWPGTTFRDGKLTVLIKDVSLCDDLEEVSLGDFEIVLDLTNPSDSSSLDIESVDGTQSSEGYYHPHVSDTGLCAGRGQEIMCNALCQGRLEDYFRIVESILRTYNGASPYVPLSDWYNPNHEGEFFCERCEEYRPEDESSFCSGCENSYCYNCEEGGGTCTDCSEWRCDDCTVSCQDCYEPVCEACRTSCSNCGNTSCSSCLEECAECCNKSCSSCRETCSGCSKEVCDECNRECDCCGSPCCDECLGEKCTRCSSTICGECEKTCDNCEKILCTDCKSNQCEDCGVPMCKSCGEEHNCILSEVDE